MRAERIWGEGPGRRREVVRILAAGSVRDSFAVDLTEPGEVVKILVAYVGKERDALRLNYRVNHIAPETKSEIFVCGVLTDAAQKDLGMTIDFRRGCTGALGEEREDAMILKETVVNKARPVIYCGEESVLGTHGASAGRINEAAVDYLMTRGVSRAVARKLLVRAKLWQLIGKIEDEKLRKQATKQLERALKECIIEP